MIIFAWSGFPQYAARCVGAFVKTTSEDVLVVATKPRVPVEGMDRLSGCPIIWCDRNDCDVLKGRVLDAHTQLIVSGWAIPVFNDVANEVRRVGGKVYVMNDANYLPLFGRYGVGLAGIRDYLVQCARALAYRLKRRSAFRGVFVPGKAGRLLARFYGVPDNRICEGMYSADPTLFHDGLPITQREKIIVYVGQLCDRKNVLAVATAFRTSGIADKGWSLKMYGCGPQKEALPPNDAHFEVHDFLQPEQLSEVYRGARAFILASKEEHWGLVVHEAALSGCYLLLSNRIGAAHDLLTSENGALFDPYKPSKMVKAFRHLSMLSDDDLRKSHDCSVGMAAQIGLENFVEGVRNLLRL